MDDKILKRVMQDDAIVIIALSCDPLQNFVAAYFMFS